MTGELILLLDRREMQVRLEGRALRIEQPEGAIERVPLGVLGSVIVHGSPLVACDVWRALAERNIPAVLLPARGQGVSVCLCGGLSNTIRLRRRQHRAGGEKEARLTVARCLVGLKLQAQKRLLDHLTRTMPAPSELPGLPAEGAAGPYQIIERNLALLAGAPDTATLMGLEGTVAAAWWNWLGTVLPKHWRFAGRNRRPPRDPVNALLSLSYTLLGVEMLKQVQEDGLDPALGFLHGIVPGRESLVLDLIEPLRPSADAFVLALLERELSPRHFTFSHQDGCRLNKTGRGLYYRAWATRRNTWPELLPPEEGPAAAVTSIQQHPEAQGQEDGRIDAISLSGQCRRIARTLRNLLDSLIIPGDEIDG
jgi:CRISPR-associated protein Cas1